MRRWIAAALAAVLMTAAVCLVTVLQGEAEADHFAGGGKMVEAATAGTGEKTPIEKEPEARNVGDRTPADAVESEAEVKHESSTEAEEVKYDSAKMACETYPDEDYVLRVITAEGGTDQLVCNGVVQCLYNACQRDGWAHSVTGILREYQYTGAADWISDEARSAWDAVFCSGVTFVDFGDALYFYAPAYGESPWHESQRFVAEIHGVRFFGRW